MATRGHVLVLDGNRVPALDIVRSLGRAGISVTVGAVDQGAIAFRSRFCRGREIYPDPSKDADAFIAWLEEAIGRLGCELVMPVTDLTVVPISRNFSRLRALCAIATEPFEKLQVVTDKLKTLAVAQQVGVPCPATVVVRDEPDLERHLSALTFPVVGKPMASSTWSAAGYSSWSVFYALDAAELRREVAKCVPACPVLLQEYRAGTGVGVEVLARSGEILQAFQHQRLHELPLTGGGSTYRVSVPVDGRLRDYASRMMAAIGWTGVAMVEFKVNEASGEIALMEINGRFWGSLPLSSRAGMPFAPDLFAMLVRGTTPPPRDYTAGVRCRKLRDDIEWFKEAVALDANHPHVAAGLLPTIPARRLLADALRLMSPRDRYDVQLLSDPVPGLCDLRDIVITQLKMARRKVAAVRRQAASAWYRRRNRSRLAGRMRDAERVLFVCYGNVMRSPFASAYFAHRGAAGRQNVEVASAGFFERTGRPADARAVSAGRRWGIDLSSHCSRRLDNELVAWADLILVMDWPNLAALRRSYPAAAGKTYLLGCIGGDAAGDVEIRDPFDGPYEATERTYVRIADAIDRFVAFGRRAEAQP
jgi:protein-tyrosine-phosphatase/predicted ATP-grasp superfamily ATP-dependent carboligase